MHMQRADRRATDRQTDSLGIEIYKYQQDTSKPAKGKRGNKKGTRGREPTIVIVFFLFPQNNY
jgi:hypothetical protein